MRGGILCREIINQNGITELTVDCNAHKEVIDKYGTKTEDLSTEMRHVTVTLDPLEQEFKKQVEMVQLLQNTTTSGRRETEKWNEDRYCRHPGSSDVPQKGGGRS